MKSIASSFTILLLLAAQAVYSQDRCETILGSSSEIEEHSVRQGPVAAHLYLDSSTEPYFFIGFPAGNSGVALWMKTKGERAELQTLSAPVPRSRDGGLNGIEVKLRSRVKTLSITESVLGSMRFVRDRELGFKIPDEMKTERVHLNNGKLNYERVSLNGLARYVLEIEALGDTRMEQTKEGYQLNSDQEVTFKISGLTSETPLTPVALQDFFKDEALAKMDPKKLRDFSFLLYKEKLMAGAPRYFSKFGRDTIFSLRILMDAMKPEAIESLLTALLSSMHPSKGLISHEQNEGDFASYVRMNAHRRFKGVSTPIEDYKMIDDDFAFTAVLGKYLMDYPERAKAFLDRKDQRGFVQRELVLTHFEYVMRSTKKFAEQPVYGNLIRLHDGEKAGQWRDSDSGLGGGQYPFDVNVALVPAALKALAELSRQKGGEFFDPSQATRLHQAFEVWNTQALSFFEVRISPQDAAVAGERYLQRLGVLKEQWPRAPKDETVFFAISLAEDGEPIPIMHSDDSLMMVFGYPSRAYLQTVNQRLLRPPPYGLMTPVGVLVANAAFASEELQRQFDASRYHGHVSWSMQEDLLIYGIDRQLQLQRTDLSSARQAVRNAAAAKESMGGNEVFSIFYRRGRYIALPFAGDAKSNSNQLWSHLRLGIPTY